MAYEHQDEWVNRMILGDSLAIRSTPSAGPSGRATCKADPFIPMDSRCSRPSARRRSIPKVEAFVKNAGLGFAIPHLHNGQPHDYLPDFIIRLASSPPSYLVLETKGFDDLADVKAAAAERWVAAVNADGQHGSWRYAMALNGCSP